MSSLYKMFNYFIIALKLIFNNYEKVFFWKKKFRWYYDLLKYELKIEK